MEIKVCPSLLSCDFLHLEREVIRARESGADMLHFDVMDGMFVNNISFGTPILEAVKRVGGIPLDVHLMITDPLKYIDTFAKCGADMITFHIEAASDVGATVKQIKRCGMSAGIAIKPDTPAESVYKYLSDADMILVMTVEPGFGGQSFISNTLGKITQIRKAAEDIGRQLDIQVDGGINHETAKLTVEAGANVIVSGSYLFASDDMADKIALIKAL